jgi:hypothetical protein
VAYFEQTRFDPETDIYTESDLIADRLWEERNRILDAMGLLPVTGQHGLDDPFDDPFDESFYGAGYHQAWTDIFKIVTEAK